MNLKKLLEHPMPQTDHSKQIEALQREMLRIQQGVFFAKRRAIIMFEGFDAAGKGGAIRRITELLDARSVTVHPISAPDPIEQGKHWLYRFWTKLPEPGHIAIFDRSWYGRVLVERVENLTPKADWKRGYREIRQFEEMLVNDGIDLVKIFLAISKDEQLERFKQRLGDPYKQWKLVSDDIRARQKWDDYVEAMSDALKETHTKLCPWHVIPADNKNYARLEVLRTVTRELKKHGRWMEKKAAEHEAKAVKKALKELEHE